MNNLLKKVAYWLFVCISLLFAGYIATEAALGATGRGCSIPCGEDGWRWGLMRLILSLWMLPVSTVTGLAVFIYFQVRLGIRMSTTIAFVFCLQSLAALIVLVILEWPAVIYQPPLCE